jgi:hypothetical protein
MGRRKHSERVLGWRSASGRIAPQPSAAHDSEPDATSSSSQAGASTTHHHEDEDTQMSFGDDFVGGINDSGDDAGDANDPTGILTAEQPSSDEESGEESELEFFYGSVSDLWSLGKPNLTLHRMFLMHQTISSRFQVMYMKQI